MLYVRTNEDHEVLEFPLWERNIRESLPNVSLPDRLTDEVLAPYGYACVPPIPFPPAPAGYVLRPGTPIFVDGKWKRTFVNKLIDLPRSSTP